MRIHVVAVSGTGMGPLAGLLVSLGHQVTGSDQRFDPPIGPRLVEWGVQCLTGFQSRHLDYGPDLVIVGNLCRKDNVEVVAARRAGLELTHIGGALQRFVLRGTRPLVVAGTHGKTTTSALATTLLQGAGREPGYLIGGVPQGLTASFRPPPKGQTGAPFVLEGDEYDTAYFEKTAKFLHYQAQVLVLTSMEHDHIDIYPTLESYREPFRRLVQQMPAQGVIVANAADPELRALLRSPAGSTPVFWYALAGDETDGVEPDVVARPLGPAPPAPEAPEAGSPGPGFATRFELEASGFRGEFQLALAGDYNVANATAALASAVHGYGLSWQQLAEPLAAFRGIARRQQLLATPSGVAVYDDFAHHPTAVRQTLRALKARHSGRLFAVFEPRSATACRRLHQDLYPGALAEADVVLLAPVGRPLPADERLDVQQVAERARLLGRQAAAFDGVEAIVAELVAQARSGDAIAVLSNGSFGGLHARLVKALASRRAGAAEE